MRALFAKLMVPVSMACLSAVSFAQSSTGSDAAAQGSRGAPEINPGLLSAGLVLLIGGTLILVSRRRARLATQTH